MKVMFYTIRIEGATYQCLFPDNEKGRELAATWIIEMLAVVPYDPFQVGHSITVTRQN